MLKQIPRDSPIGQQILAVEQEALARGISQEVLGHYAALRLLPDGRLIGVTPLLFHWTLHIGIDWMGYAERYCYRDQGLALYDMLTWSGKGDPQHWHKHPTSGRRRDLKTGVIWSEDEITPLAVREAHGGEPSP